MTQMLSQQEGPSALVVILVERSNPGVSRHQAQNLGKRQGRKKMCVLCQRKKLRITVKVIRLMCNYQNRPISHVCAHHRYRQIQERPVP